MFQRLKNMVFIPGLALLVTLTMSLGFASAASAAPTYQPSFSPNQHVYLDPLLENGTPAVNLNGLEQKLVDEGKKHNVDYYFVMALKGSEAIQQGVPFARSRLDDLVGKWTGSKNFNSGRYVILYVVRLDNDWTKSSYAINTAPALASEGLTSGNMLPVMDQWGKNSNGSNPNSLLPRAPRDFAAKIAAESNRAIEDTAANIVRQAELRKQQAENARVAEIRRQEQARQDEIQRRADAEKAAAQRVLDEKAAAERNAAIASFFKIWTAPVVILIIFGFLAIRLRSSRARARTALAAWRAKIEPASSNYLQLETDYLSFLESMGGTYEGDTQAALAVAKASYGTLSARIKKAIAMADEAEKAISKSNLVSVGACNNVVALLTTAKLTVTGDDIPLAQRSLFGASVSEQTFTPDELFKDMETLFATANASCSSIMHSYKGAEQNQRDIEGLIADVTKLQGELSERGLSFGPYEAAFAAVAQGRKEFMTLMGKDPLQAYTKSEMVETAVGALKALIDRAVHFKDSLAGSDKVIAAAQAKVDAARNQPADYKYFDAFDTTGLPAKTLLNEQGGNPDVPLGAARDALVNSQTLLARGALEEAGKAKSTAEAEAGKAASLVDTVLAARSFVQKEVVSAIERLAKLRGEIPAADTAGATLKAEFLAKNYEGETAKVTRAHTVADTMDAELAKVKKAFAEQRYLAARAEVEETGKDIDGARNGVTEVLSRLKTLQGLRDHARATVKSNLQAATTLAGKLESNTFTTSAKTDEEYNRLLPLNSNQKSDVARDVTDWVEAAAASDRVAVALKAVDTAIDEQRKAYELAKARVKSTVDAVNMARSTFQQNYVRTKAEGQYDAVKNRAGQLDAALKAPKSDWNALTSTVENIKRDLDSAVALANADQQAGENAEAAIAEAGGEIRAVDNKGYSTSRRIGGRSPTFGNDISANVSTANGSMRRAQSEMQNGNYEAAAQSARRAKSEAEQADREAQQQVAAAIAIAVAAYEAEQERERERERQRQREEDARQQRQRDEEARQQRQRDDDNRRSSSSSSSSDAGSSGSGFSGGGGSSGGGDF